MAFFPCVRFEDQIVMAFAGTKNGLQKKNETDKLIYDLKLHRELHELYGLITKLAIVCIRLKIPTIIENPKGNMHYLSRYWALKPSLIDYDRSERGDFYRKPTQFWFLNREPSNNFIFGEQVINKMKNVIDQSKVERSMISPDYANRFIREFVI